MANEDRRQTYIERGVASQPAAGSLAFTPSWTSRAEAPGFSPLPGVTMQPVTGGRIMFSWVTIEPESEVPLHQHPHEQVGFILDGELELTVGDETRRLRTGDAYTIPPELPHAARTGATGCLLVDIFSPPREDYLAAVRRSASA